MESIEKVAETVEAAIQAGLRELNCGPDDVMVEVLEEPSRGFLGIGARPARVRLIFIGRRPEPPKEAPPSAPAAPSKPARSKSNRAKTEATSKTENAQGDADGAEASEANAASASTSDERAASTGRKRRRRRGGRGRSERTERGERGERSSKPRQGGGRSASAFEYDYPDDDDFSTVPSANTVADEDADEDVRVGKQVLLELLDKMGYYDVQITLHRAESTRADEDMHWVLNITGPEVQSLAARRGESLASIQYLLRLMLSRRLQRRVNIIVDVAEYKLHRAQRLQQLATRMADQAIAQGRTVTLEPMPPHERRIIHLTLRERQDVETRSIGEGSARKVTISPVKSSS
ncbi:MAG: Jag N-terminal domain-containing protein [Anaerolineae bacterium]|nr:Jag N-terminal domain-containing protein [Anaerolineae bacterium]MDW8173062.1 RNA-binding cell elongation regulator Jag/EloR [Anaerolineae bacterium]